MTPEELLATAVGRKMVEAANKKAREYGRWGGYAPSPAEYVEVALRVAMDDTCPTCYGTRMVDDPDLLARFVGQGEPEPDDEDALHRIQCWMPCINCHAPDRGPTGKVTPPIYALLGIETREQVIAGVIAEFRKSSAFSPCANFLELRERDG